MVTVVTETESAQPGGRRDALIQAAISVVAKNGLSRLTYRSLAAEAGVTHGSVQHHFDSIDDVLEAALEWSIATSLSPLQEHSTPTAFIEDVQKSVVRSPEIHSFQFQVTLESHRRESLRPLVLRLYESYWEATERSLIMMGLDPDPGFVRAVLAAGEGIILLSTVLGRDDPIGANEGIEGLRQLLEAAVFMQKASVGG